MFNQCSTHLGQEIAFLVQKRPILTLWGPLVALFKGPTGPNRPPGYVGRCASLFNQCSTHFGLLEVSMVRKLHFWSKNSQFQRFWGPPVALNGVPKGSNRPPGCVGRCSTLFHHCSTPLGRLEVFMVWKLYFWSKNGQFQRFRAPPVALFGGLKGPN